MDFSVIIPTYNGANKLPKVLDCLQEQIKINNLIGEIIIIDNNSTDSTVNVIKTYQENWQFSWPLKYYFEPQQGLAFARKRAIKEAKGKLISFIDDDNLPQNNWIYEAYEFSKKYPQVGAFSGKIVGDFEQKTPDNFGVISQFLAIRDHGQKPCLFEPEKLRLPPGAGLVVRRQAWIESVPQKTYLIGRVGKYNIAGEDYEVLLYLHKKGWEIWYNPKMILHHVIPKDRLSQDYLLPLAMGTGLATCQLRMILAKNWQKPLILVRTILGNFRRILLHLLKYKSEVNNNLISAFELQFYWGSFLSPFYYLKTIFNPK
ncbi:hormogonium polysaccharide biosynthesis glycosyltransferase HpsE [Crocosphaera sp.]|uniref:hormogonium polysaccharide biosynthesis glycosyltransferase HpsE n=1 Tax=Crocosphaera sp. TaxID=2729996 RepID=UPI00260621FC|nr:hormogonium polysaccharide biosynthesis glycosyltransferase HpsE [Crocosphaera sp.]MDJ0580105.1 hormogonium polysaccharide biosynthesis glycosyltransferase HpsE [Crocosphaera sp.]